MTEACKQNADPFALIVRLLWIDDVIEEEGTIQRGDIMRAFGTSLPQASIDLRHYRDRHPNRLHYDLSARAYVAVEGSKPLFTRGHRQAANAIVDAIRDLRQ